MGQLQGKGPIWAGSEFLWNSGSSEIPDRRHDALEHFLASRREDDLVAIGLDQAPPVELVHGGIARPVAGAILLDYAADPLPARQLVIGGKGEDRQRLVAQSGQIRHRSTSVRLKIPSRSMRRPHERSSGALKSRATARLGGRNRPPRLHVGCANAALEVAGNHNDEE